LGRGITFQSKSFTFDYAVIPGIKDAASAYQCVARVLGNIRSFSPWTPTVYMSSPLLAAVLRQERIAANLARLVHENEWVDVGANEIAEAAGEERPPARAADVVVAHESISHLEEFSSMEALSARWASILAAGGQPHKRTPRTPNRTTDGVYVCSIGRSSEKQTAADIRRKFPEGSGTANWGSGITEAEAGEYVQRVYAGYQPDETVVFFLRWTVKAEESRDSRGGGGGTGA
jgi:hypothetical protein